MRISPLNLSFTGIQNQKQTTRICPKGRPLIQHLSCDTIWDNFGDINPSKQLPVLYIDIWYGSQLTSISTNLEIISTGLKSPTSRNRVLYPSLQLDVILRMTTIQGIFLSEQNGMLLIKVKLKHIRKIFFWSLFYSLVSNFRKEATNTQTTIDRQSVFKPSIYG